MKKDANYESPYFFKKHTSHLLLLIELRLFSFPTLSGTRFAPLTWIITNA